MQLMQLIIGSIPNYPTYGPYVGMPGVITPVIRIGLEAAIYLSIRFIAFCAKLECLIKYVFRAN